LAECTKVQGYFIGTCYDGKKVFELLKKKKNGENFTIMNGARKMYEVTKMYDETGFPDDEMSLGYPINVYQESINKVFREYLVNFDYFIRVMENYGFTLISKNEAQHMNLPDGSGLFSDLFAFMENEIRMNPKHKSDYCKAIYMNQDEKTISFLNRYFIFRKVNNVNTDKISKILKHQSDINEKIEDEIMEKIEKDIEKEEKASEKITIRRKKTDKKVILSKI
jgi:hypothetical protein